MTSNGLTPQSGDALNRRIDALLASRQIPPTLASRLKDENQADEKYRARMIWFCFYPPEKAGQHGIERFFRSWGGEALYNSHESAPDTGPLLGRIGVPCLVEADVPIGKDKHNWLENRLALNFLTRRGFSTVERLDYEGYCTTHIPAANIRRVIRHPEPDFIALTGVDTWRPPLPQP